MYTGVMSGSTIAAAPNSSSAGAEINAPAVASRESNAAKDESDEKAIRFETADGDQGLCHSCTSLQMPSSGIASL
jgi:hypothetical protein